VINEHRYKGERHIGGVELRDGESVLWSHVLTHKDETAGPNKKVSLLLRYAFPLICIANMIILSFVVLRMPPEDIKQTLQIALFVIAIVWLFSKVDIHKLRFWQTNRPVFRNGIITNQRIVFFNQYIGRAGEKARQDFTQSDIADVTLDYENGGRALSVRRRKDAKDSVLIGIADFEAALKVATQQFLEPTS